MKNSYDDFVEKNLKSTSNGLPQARRQTRSDVTTIAAQGLITAETEKRSAASAKLRHEREAKEADPAWVAARAARIKASKVKTSG